MEDLQSYDDYHAERLESKLKNGQQGDMENFGTFLHELADEFFGGTEACSRLSALDVACGYMREAGVLAGLFEKPVCAIDRNSRRIGDLTARMPYGDVEATVGDARDLESIYGDSAFDVVLVRHPFIEVKANNWRAIQRQLFGDLNGKVDEDEDVEGDDWTAMYEQCIKVLKPGGVLLTNFHNRDEMLEAEEILEGLGVDVLKLGQNDHATWDNDIEGFYGEDGFFIVARKTVEIGKIVVSVRRNLREMI